MALPIKTVVKPFVELTRKKQRLGQQLKDTQARLAVLEEKLAESFVKEGIQSTSLDGMTVYLSRSIYAAAMDGDKEGLYKALTEAGESWAWLVKDNVNAQQLAARVRECDLNDQNMPILPDDLMSAIKVTEVFRVKARKSE